ncbi:transglutaminase-like domain-containing protein [Caulobacter sp. KR2-114]|uniref:transglutaminase-like domain-containing protein n=1 Tax=Caulobacter sp. KR2-114 TaxID=3400912 RepID=UPI003C009720
MKIRAGYRIAFECEEAATILLMLSSRWERHADLLTPDIMTVEPYRPIRQYSDLYGNLCTRVAVQPGRTTFSADFLMGDSGLPDPVTPDAVQHPIENLPDETLVFLLASRYCDTQALMQTAWDLFGQTPPGWARVQAIVQYAHERISFGYHHARPTRTASEAHEERVGVCRDFAHLAITLCRCMNIPARYCTGYLGDIGVPPVDAPMDFSAWFEVYLGGAWRTFDARHNRPRIGRILIAIGRDATDVAISTSFGRTELVEFTVLTQEVADDAG